MTSQFNEVVAAQIYSAAADDVADAEVAPHNPGFVEEKLLDYLSGLDVGKRLPGPILIKVIAKDDTSVTFLLRGRMKINKSRFSPFVRMEMRVNTTALQIDVDTFIAELKIVESDAAPLTEVRMGLGYDGLIFSGRGGAKVIPIGFGLAIFLGRVSDSGIMIGIDVFLPTPIPLGPCGLGLSGIGGDYAHNFKPRLESGLEAEGPKLNLETGETDSEGGVAEIENPTAIHYLHWARNPDEALDRWVPGPPDQTVIGIGVRAVVTDQPSAGKLLQIGPAGFAVFTPGAIIILGGEGKLLTLDSLSFDAFAVIDSASGSFALGGGIEMLLPKESPAVEVTAVFESFFSRTEPETWFVRIGSERDPAKAKFLVKFSGKAYFELNHYRFAFGLEIMWKEVLKYAKVFEVFIQGGGGIRGLLGWNPRQIAGEFFLKAEAGFKAFKIFKLSASLNVSLWGHIPQPKALEATTEFKLNLPFPLKSAKVKVKLPREFENQAPVVELPFGDVKGRAGALHGLSGRQWDLANPSAIEIDQAWPDVDLVIPFRSRMTDETGKVIGPAIGPEDQGGYDVHHRLTRLELHDVTNDVAVDGVQAVWAEGPDGATAQLHVLAQDPYAWLFWNESVSSSLTPPVPDILLQLFGIGDSAVFTDARRFGLLRVTPDTTAELTKSFDFALPRRVIRSDALTIDFRTAAGAVIDADLIRFFVIEERNLLTTESLVTVVGAEDDPLPIDAQEFFPGLWLVVYEVGIAPDTAEDGFQITAIDGHSPVNLYGVLFREAVTAKPICSDKVTLSPGRYRLTVEGSTSAASQDDFANPDDQDWHQSWEFEVVYPYALRPYLRDTTIGDTRMLRAENLAWNPTLFGFGFPAYRGYLPAIGFLVPYIADIFPTLEVRVVYEDEATPDWSFTAEPLPAADGQSSILEPSADFRNDMGCPAGPDRELEADNPLTASGAADLRISFEDPDGETRRLDSWSCYVSRYLGFAEHLALASSTLRQVYDTEGPRLLQHCLTPGGLGLSGRRSIGGGRVETVLAAPTGGRANPTAPLLGDFPIAPNPTFPDELETPPLPWRLPTSIGQHLDEDDISLAVAFFRFARATEVVFDDVPETPHFGLANTVEETTLEALVDAQGRPYALWLRTPEPLDWRRVSGGLSIRHLKGDDPCASEYAFRKKLSLDIEILPGPDASSAFVVGSLAGIRTRLPSGEYTLSLTFDPAGADLPRLRPGPQIEIPKETAVLKFLQRSGQNWPTPEQKMRINARLLEQIVAAAERSDPDIRQFFDLATAELATALELSPPAKRGQTPNRLLNRRPGSPRQCRR